jgi:predicted alpha-1,2-mannosidase
MQKILIRLIVVAVSLAPSVARAQYAKYVDPYIGSEGGGHVFVGATVPFGMVKAGPDVGDNIGNGGWLPDGDINGFSQMHVTGTGGGAKYGNILVQPVTGEFSADDHSSPRSAEQVRAGLYSVRLNRYNTDVAITTTRRAAIYRFIYPQAERAGILFDAGHCLSSYPNQQEDQRVIASEISFLSNHEVSGSTTVVGGWNQQKKPYRVYFYATSSAKGISFSTWEDGNGAVHALAGGTAKGVKTGAWMEFKTRAGEQAFLKVGISFVSVAQAKQNATQEIPGFAFERTHTQAEHTWNAALGRAEVQGISDEQKKIFYTALYHTMLMPSDRTGENAGWQSNEPYYDDFYAIWDTFRSSGPLLTLIAPERQTGMVRALVDMYRHEGWLPDARSGNSNGRTQGGSNAEFVLTDAYLKHLPGIDWNEAYAAMKHDAEVAPSDQIMEGRGGLEDWKTKGYLTIEGVDRPASKQMEYAANDYEIALLAKALGKTADYEIYRKRSQNWENLWNSAYEEDGVKGFIWPRHKDGSWKTKFNGLEGCSWGGETFYEGNSWTYSTFVPHDTARLIEKSGGAEAFVKRLDLLFSGAGRYDVGNEPGFLAPYLYLWAGRSDKVAEHLREILAKNYHAGRSGIPGNDDSGAMSSWYAFGAMGIYPNAGQDVYLIGSPTIPETTLHLAAGRTFVIKALNVSEQNKYIASVELNGKPYSSAWFHHEDIIHGGSLVLHMAPKPTNWPTGAPPPSASTEAVK